jgi:hypothetical protein
VQRTKPPPKEFSHTKKDPSSTTNSANKPPYKEDGDALYEYAVMKAFGLCTQEKNLDEAVALFTRAARVGHPISLLGLHVPPSNIMPLCRCFFLDTMTYNARIYFFKIYLRKKKYVKKKSLHMQAQSS